MTTAGAGLSRSEAPAAGGSLGALHALVEALLVRFANDPWMAEVGRAKDAFLSQSGKVFEDDGELHTKRMAAFQEWYLVEWPFDGGLPLGARLLQGEHGGVEEASRQALASLVSSHRALFDVALVEPHALVLEDVLSGARFSVRERRGTIGFEVGDLLEARLLWDGEAVGFGRTVLFHPREARDEILAVADAELGKKRSAQDLLFLLARLHLRWRRLGHGGAARVYREALLR